MNHIYNITSPLTGGSHYGNKGFASPMNELNEQTVLVENCENKNDSYRQKTKYDDKTDSYYSTYDIGILLQNTDSYLEGKLETNEDTDYYSFSYTQRSFYEKMEIGTKVTIRLEHIPEDCDYDLVVYDTQGNQIGMAKDTGDGSKELTLPDWNNSGCYTIKVENHGGRNADAEQPYRIRITEEKFQKDTTADGGQEYDDEIEKLHKEQYHSLPEDERYTGTKTVEELLEKKASGKSMDKREEAYLKIFASLQEYERAAASSRMKNTWFPKIQDALEKAGLDLRGREYAIEMDLYGKISVTGDLSEEEKQTAARVLKEQFSDELWNCHMQASDSTTAEYRRIDAYREISGFLQKSTNGRYSWSDISVDENGKIRGLSEKMCQLLNSQESNGRYEQLRDDIFMLYDYEKIYGMQGLSDYKVKYEVSGSNIKMITD